MRCRVRFAGRGGRIQARAHNGNRRARLRASGDCRCGSIDRCNAVLFRSGLISKRSYFEAVLESLFGALASSWRTYITTSQRSSEFIASP
jgi:hypothetical protein